MIAGMEWNVGLCLVLLNLHPEVIIHHVGFTLEAPLHDYGRMASTRGHQNLLSGSEGLGSHFFDRVRKRSKESYREIGNKSSVCKKSFESAGKKKKILSLQYIPFAQLGQFNGLLSS